MKLLNFKVLSDFRNLKGIELRFNSTNSTYVLIGNNGAGKSSLLEALSSVFHRLYSQRRDFEFNFTLSYLMSDNRVSIGYKPGKKLSLKVSGVAVTYREFMQWLPQRIVCNYSGEEFRIKQLYFDPLWAEYENRLKNAQGGDPLRMVFVDKDLWRIILYIIIAQRTNYDSFEKFLVKTIGVESVNSVKVKINTDELDRWSDNPVSFYIRQLASKIKDDDVIDIADMNPGLEEAITMFANLSSARRLIDIDIVYNKNIDSEFLSEGEKKLMVVLFILEVLSDERSLVLLDEPDSHIHIARKPALVEFFKRAVNRENILTSHSPSLTSEFDKSDIIMLDRSPEGFARVIEAEKQQIVERLTDGRWSLQQQNIFLASNKDIILVEGPTDETYLSTALNVFKEDGLFADMNFQYLPCGGADGVVELIKHFKPKLGQHIYCFLDNDDKGWDGINKIFEKPENHKFSSSNFGLAQKKGDFWIAPYPFDKPKAGNSNIEDYFPRTIFVRYIMKFKSLNTIIDKKGLKESLEEDCKNNKLKPKAFRKFKVVFMLIQEMRLQENKGKTNVETLCKA